MSWQMAVVAGIGGVMQMASTQSAASTREQSARIQEQQYTLAAEETMIQAQQEESKRRLRLRTITASNLADAGARGISSDDPSFKAIQDANEEDTATDIGNIRYMGMSRRRRYLLGAEDARNQQEAAQTAGMLGVVSSLFSFGTKAMGSMGGFGFGGGGSQSTSGAAAP